MPLPLTIEVSFLVVYITPLPFDMYLEGQEMVNNLVCIGIEVIGNLVSYCYCVLLDVCLTNK